MRLHLAYRHTMLISSLFLLACALGADVYFSRRIGHRGIDSYLTVAMALMLLFNHLAYGGFSWPRRVAAGIRILAWSWIAFTCSYLVYVVGVALTK
jgi:hypothetical protein